MSDKKSKLLIFKKEITNQGLLIELKVWSIAKSNRYPLGLKYRLVLANPKTHYVLLLFDNHWPKGPHVHEGKQEYSYNFINLETLLIDFDDQSRIEEKRYRENKENSD